MTSFREAALESEDAQPDVRVESLFVRYRNALLTRADFSGLFARLDEHLRRHGLDEEADNDLGAFRRDVLAAFTLHLTGRPRTETLAWTINFQHPRVNVFAGGDSEYGSVVVRLFTENVKVDEKGAFHQEMVRPGKPNHRSFVDFEGTTPTEAVERFYLQSEQRPARFLRLEDHQYALLAAHPDYDEGWFSGVDHEAIRGLNDDETLVPIEQRGFNWHCGCSHGRILEVLNPIFEAGPEELFRGDESVTVNCPRCAGRYVITREALEAVSASGEA